MANKETKEVSVPVNDYSFLIGIEKTIFRMVVIAGPLVIGLLPAIWMNVTLGAVLTFVINFAKNYPTDASNQAQ